MYSFSLETFKQYLRDEHFTYTPVYSAWPLIRIYDKSLSHLQLTLLYNIHCE